jgi:arylsulfatase A-like enzyme
MGSLIFAACVLFSAAGEVEKPERPNIVWILADDLGYGDLGCYGQKVIKTPHLDRLAAGGMRFTHCYSGSTVCGPSRCCLMTGLHTGHSRIRGNGDKPLRPEDVTVATLLKRAGYETFGVGKWGLGDLGTTGLPNLQGFDYWFGYLNHMHAHNYYPDVLYRNAQPVKLDGNVVRRGVALQKKVYAPDLMLQEALGVLDRTMETPFFLFFASTLPHANNETGRATGDGMEIPDHGDYAKESWPSPAKGRAAMISRLDADVGKLLTKLKERGLLDKTVVFFTSDNGPHQEGGSFVEFFDSNGPLRGWKRDLYEGGVRVPLIVSWPGHVPAGKVVDQPVAFWDFLPTATALAGIEGTRTIDGVSLKPTLLGRRQDWPDRFYWEFHERGFSQATLLGAWKGVRNGSPTAPTELYDLSNDPGEQRNVAADHPEIVEKAARFLAGARTESADWPIRPAGQARKRRGN